MWTGVFRSNLLYSSVTLILCGGFDSPLFKNEKYFNSLSKIFNHPHPVRPEVIILNNHVIGIWRDRACASFLQSGEFCIMKHPIDSF